MVGIQTIRQSVQALMTVHEAPHFYWRMCNSNTKIRASRHVELRSLETAVGKVHVVLCILIQLRSIVKYSDTSFQPCNKNQYWW